MLNVRILTVNQFNDPDNYPQLHLTSETLTWDLSTDHYEQQEDVMMDLTGNFLPHDLVRGQRHLYVIDSISSASDDLLDINEDNNFHDILLSHIVISRIDTGINFLTGNVQARKTLKTLAKHRGISPSAAKWTVVKTTQQGVWTCLTPMLL